MSTENTKLPATILAVDDVVRANSYLAAIVESSDDAIISKNLNGIITSWNASAERMFGYEAQEAIGQSITLIIPQYLLPEEHSIISRLRKGEKIDHFETIRQAKSGRLLNLSITVSPIRDASGQIVGASKVARDITEQKRAEEERKRLESELEAKAHLLAEKDRRKDEFLAMLAHELRNPLAPVSNALNILMSAAASEDIRAQASELAKRQLGQMTRLLDDLLDVSRITLGKIELRRETIVLSEAIQTAIETVTPSLKAREQTLNLELHERPLCVNGDFTRLSQVFANLLHNASKYSHQGGRIEIHIGREGANAVIRIKDDGIGIPVNELDSIFEIFSQVDNSMERRQGGLGLGLTLVKRLVEMHGGTVSAHSGGLDKGSEFLVTLPELPSARSEKNAKVSPDEAPSDAYRILVVDDNEASAKTLGWMLELFGHSVSLARNGTEAIETAKRFRPDIVLLDLGLPGMSGYEVCQHMRADDALKHTFIIAQTGWGQKEHRERSKQAGFDYHLVKPVEAEVLRSVLAGVKDKRVRPND